MKFDNIIFYSINSYLAFFINTNFYNESHYVWCSPVFNCDTLDVYDIRRKIPPSSNPFKIYSTLKDDVVNNDTHSNKIESIKKGIRSGATIRCDKGLITQHELGLIMRLVEKSALQEHRPLIYLIPSEIVKARIETVDIEERANPLGVEYRITDLKRNEFEIIEF